MTQSFLCKIPFLGKFVDERFLEHRRRSTSVAGIIAVIAGVIIFDYRLLHDHIWSWDLLICVLTFAVIKLSMMAWFRLNG